MYEKQVRLGKNLQTRLIPVTFHIRLKSGLEPFLQQIQLVIKNWQREMWMSNLFQKIKFSNLQILLGLVLRETENNTYAKCWRESTKSITVFLNRPFEIHWLLTSLYEKMKLYLLLKENFELELRQNFG